MPRRKSLIDFVLVGVHMYLSIYLYCIRVATRSVASSSNAVCPRAHRGGRGGGLPFRALVQPLEQRGRPSGGVGGPAAGAVKTEEQDGDAEAEHQPPHGVRRVGERRTTAGHGRPHD